MESHQHNDPSLTTIMRAAGTALAIESDDVISPEHPHARDPIPRSKFSRLALKPEIFFHKTRPFPAALISTKSPGRSGALG